MRVRWRQSLMLLLILSVTWSLAACGGSTTGGEAKNGEGAKQDDDSQQPLTIEWLTYQYGPVDEDAPNKKFLEDKFNVKFNIWYLDVTKREELLGAKLAGGQVPDFMTVYSGADLQKFYKSGVTTSFTQEELEQYMPNYKKLVDSIDPNIWSYAKFNGEYIGIPSINGDGEFSLATAWRKDWLDKVGIAKIPETLDEFEEAMYKFRNDDPDGNGQKDTYGMSRSAMTSVYGAYGVYPEFWTVRDGKIVWGGILPETKQALERLAKWKKDDVISPEWVLETGENTGGYWALSNDFINGKIGVSNHGSNYHWTPPIPEIKSEGGVNWVELKKVNPQAEIGFGKPPVGPEGKFGNITPGFVGGTYMAFGKRAGDNAELKHTIMRIWDEVYGNFDMWQRMKYGELGVHSEKADDGITIVWKEEYAGKNEMQAKIGANITFAPFDQPEFRARVNNPKLKEINTKLYKFEGAGYENAVKTALPSEGQYMTNLIQLQKEAFASIINGEKPIDEFDAFVEAWKQNGGDKLTEEANQWYDSLK